MAMRLPRFQSGRPLTDEVTADKLNQLVDAIRQCELNSGVGYDVNRGPGGTTLVVRPGVATTAAGRTVILGMTNSGMSHTDNSVANPGTSSYGLSCKTPTGGYTTAYVHGSYYGIKIQYNTNPTHGALTVTTKFEAFYTDISISSEDTCRSVGLLSAHQGEVFDETQLNTSSYTGCNQYTSGEYVFSNRIVNCGANNVFGLSTQITGSIYGVTSSGGTLCNGVRYYVTATCTGRSALEYYTFSSVGATAAAGSFVIDNYNTGLDSGGYVGTEALTPEGVYFYKRTFEMPDDVSPVTASVRVRVRLKTTTPGKSTIHSVRVNGANVSYGYFENQSSSLQPLLISDGFQSGSNTIEIGVTSQNFNLSYPTASFEFLPTTATLTSLSGVTVGGFADLTEAQQDLIGQGTPVKVKITGTDKIYAYNGTGSKTSSGSYTFVRDV